MSGNQGGKIEPKTIALIGAAATALVIVNMSTGTEPPSQAVIFLQCIALAVALLTFVCGLIIMRRTEVTLADDQRADTGRPREIETQIRPLTLNKTASRHGARTGDGGIQYAVQSKK